MATGMGAHHKPLRARTLTPKHHSQPLCGGAHLGTPGSGRLTAVVLQTCQIGALYRALGRVEGHAFAASPPRPSTDCDMQSVFRTEKVGARAETQTACQSAKALRRRCCNKMQTHGDALNLPAVWTATMLRGEPRRSLCAHLHSEWSVMAVPTCVHAPSSPLLDTM